MTARGGCPESCTWLTHPLNPDWQRCEKPTCQVERPKPKGMA